MHQTTTKADILEFIQIQGATSVKQLVAHFGFNKTIIHRHLNELMIEQSLTKLGKTPHVHYITPTQLNQKIYTIAKKYLREEKEIKTNYMVAITRVVQFGSINELKQIEHLLGKEQLVKTIINNWNVLDAKTQKLLSIIYSLHLPYNKKDTHERQSAISRRNIG